MATISENKVSKENKNNLFKDYPWFYSNFLENFQKSLDKFFKKDYELRFMGVSYEDNILFYGDEYFANKIPINKNSSIIMRLSSSLVSLILDNTLGASENKFSLQRLTLIEGNLLKSFTLYAYNSIESYLNKSEVNKKVIQTSKDYNFTFFVRSGNEHAGKLIITIPEYAISNIEHKALADKFGINDFKSTKVSVNISTGSTRVPLNDVKALEEGDIIVLENSDINKMAVLLNEQKVPFLITPNPSLIISIDSNGDNVMEEETSTNQQNMWDSILVDVVAEFDNVKLSLGELKQISEGLVIDVGSVYDNKIKLRVENQVVATGELVILNDRYGVRIEKVKKTKEEVQKAAPKKEVEKPAEQPKKAAPKPAAAAVKKTVPPKAPADKKQPQKDDENFDYSDFEIEDESI